MATIDPETPIPVPDVSGGDAGRRGLPSRSDLSLLQRTVVDSSAIADIGLRTMVASMVGAAMLPPVLSGLVRGSDLDRERENLAFYADLAAQHDPAVSFPAPRSRPRVSTRRANPARIASVSASRGAASTSPCCAQPPSTTSRWRGIT